MLFFYNKPDKKQNNNSFIHLLILVIFLSTPYVILADISQEERANTILRSVDDLWRGSSSHAITTMKVKTAHYSRSMKMEGWSQGKDKTLFKVLEPRKEQGTITLKSGTNIYTYLPKTDRKIRLTSGMMMGAWMGSHLTNDDLVKEARLEDDYDASISFEGKKDGKNIIEFSLIPKQDAVVVWGKIILTVLQKNYSPLIEIYYDEDMQITRRIIFSDMKVLAGRLRPSTLRVEPADKPGEYTEFIYQSLELDITINDQFFKLSNLKRH